MPLFPELEGLSTPVLCEYFTSDQHFIADPAEKELWFEEVAVKIAERGEEGLSFLIGRIPNSDPLRLRAILLSFCFLPRTVIQEYFGGLKEILLGFLPNPNDLLIASAIDTLKSLRMTDVLQDVLPFLLHQSPYVVGSVLRYLSRHYPEQAKPVLLESLKSKEPIIRQNAIDELDELGCSEALPYLRSLLQDEDGDVRQAAQTAIANLQ